MKINNKIYSLLLLLVTWLLVSCNEQDMLLSEETESEKVYWRIGITIPGEETMSARSFQNPEFEFEDLHVAVFVEAGGDYFFEELVSATDNTPVWNETNKCWDFYVALTKTEGPRRLHIIGNYPGLTMGFGEEGQLVGRLITNKQTEEHDVYWNCVEVSKIDSDFQSEVQKIPLVRNYVKIELNMKSEVWTDFELTRYALYNVPQWGTVAPFNSSKGLFANFVKSNGTCQSYDYLLNTLGYEGNEPNDDGGLFSKNLEWVTIDKDKMIPPSYIYERSNRLAQTPTSMIVAGKYKGGAETFYKLDFVYYDDKTGSKVYYNLLRNFRYGININSVVGNGYATPEEAINNPASNNIGGDAIAKDYTNISDGVGRLFVSTTYMLLTSNNQVEIYYQYIPKVSESNKTSNESVIITAPAGNVLKQNAVRANTDETSGLRNNWRKVTLTPNNPTAVAQSQTITFAAGGLQREIELVLRTPYVLSVETPDEVLSTMKTPLDVKITLPTGIPQSVFPLRLFISSENNTIYPDYGTNMPAEVQNGKYGFIREVSWEEYNNIADKTFVCKFLTNCVNSATTVYVDNEYFSRGSDSFINFKLTKLEILPNEFKCSVTVQQDNSYYPQVLTNEPYYTNASLKYNNKTISDAAKITYNNSKLTIVLNKTITLENTNGIEGTDVLVFTFSSKYRSKKNSWSSSATTFTAEITIDDLLAGKTIEFNR